MSRITRSIVVALLSLNAACAYVQRRQDARMAEWLAEGITAARAAEILGTAPYAIPDLEIVAIHVDRPSRVVTVTQRFEDGFFISLSQYRGHDIPPTTRPFWVIERYHQERVAYTPAEPRPETYFVYVDNGATASAEQRIRNRRFTRWVVEEGLTLRIWADPLGDERQVGLLYEATPIANEPN